MTFHRAIYSNMTTTLRIEVNDSGIWFQYGERGFYILWRKP